MSAVKGRVASIIRQLEASNPQEARLMDRFDGDTCKSATTNCNGRFAVPLTDQAFLKSYHSSPDWPSTWLDIR